ncbi:L,D-transpeptidase family protein [Anaeromyxobacter terrae]|uniref:L,D-transpeptidase family protein n=1 Tax=Anaeromyxobacter terrae TaxID=2925406 RepID=UPI001F59B9BC|nr:L,D-transpeptidase family protein [Anaeromyxobacter sp. SG22]
MRLALLTAGLLPLLGCVSAALPEAEAAPCPDVGDHVVVDTRARVLWLCTDRHAVARVRVALGRGGVDKEREGDGRTPLGAYTLGEPRPSRFGTFIPIGYPTAAQRARGLSGSNVGIHGPGRRLSWLGRASTWVDWTAGCVATGTDEDIARVAAFVRERRPSIVLR